MECGTHQEPELQPFAVSGLSRLLTGVQLDPVVLGLLLEGQESQRWCCWAPFEHT